jgi:hypothetical protein
LAKKASKKKRGGKYRIELSGMSLFLWGFFSLFLLGWIFVLGILVGRGLLPGSVTALTDFKSRMNRHPVRTEPRGANHDSSPGMGAIDPKLAFHEKLSVKKEEARSRPQPENKSRPTKPVSSDVPKPTETALSAESGSYTIQLAALTDKAMAEQMVGQLLREGYPAYYCETRVKGRLYYRVRCGKFVTREQAEVFAFRVARETGYKGFVTRLEEVGKTPQ